MTTLLTQSGKIRTFHRSTKIFPGLRFTVTSERRSGARLAASLDAIEAD